MLTLRLRRPVRLRSSQQRERPTPLRPLAADHEPRNFPAAQPNQSRCRRRRSGVGLRRMPGLARAEQVGGSDLHADGRPGRLGPSTGVLPRSRAGRRQHEQPAGGLRSASRTHRGNRRIRPPRVTPGQWSPTQETKREPKLPPAVSRPGPAGLTWRSPRTPCSGSRR